MKNPDEKRTINVTIYQINRDRDTDRVKFLAFQFLQKFQGTSKINGKIYDLVFRGAVECTDLEAVYRMFNTNKQEGFRGHSMSVSDVVQVSGSQENEDGVYYCNSIGFVKLPDDSMEGAIEA